MSGKPDPAGGRPERRVRLVGAVIAGDDRDPQARGELTGRRLVAEGPDGRRRRSDPADPSLDHSLGELGVLAQEAPSRMDRVGTGRPGRRDDRPRVEKVDVRSPVLARDHGSDTEPIGGPADPGGDLAAVGYE